MGTLALLQAAKLYWESLPEKYEGKRFYHISTDEVYGALEFDGTFFTEETKYQPHSPYSASKASSDHFVRASVYCCQSHSGDHARAIDLIFHQGRTADTYNIGGFNEWKNIDLIKVIIKTVDRLLQR